MRNISKERFIATDVMMEFEDGPVSFLIQRGATLADISENLDQIGKWHTGQPLSINVHFKAANDSGCDRDSHSMISSPISQQRSTRTRRNPGIQLPRTFPCGRTVDVSNPPSHVCISR